MQRSWSGHRKNKRMWVEHSGLDLIVWWFVVTCGGDSVFSHYPFHCAHWPGARLIAAEYSMLKLLRCIVGTFRKHCGIKFFPLARLAMPARKAAPVVPKPQQPQLALAARALTSILLLSRFPTQLPDQCFVVCSVTRSSNYALQAS